MALDAVRQGLRHVDPSAAQERLRHSPAAPHLDGDITSSVRQLLELGGATGAVAASGELGRVHVHDLHAAEHQVLPGAA